MRMFKTPQKNRATYVYHTATGEKIELTPADVGSTWIDILHGEDDDMVDANRKEQYHAPVHYDSLTDADGDADGLSEKLDFLADPDLDPPGCVIRDDECREHEEMLEKLREIIPTLQPQQIDLVHKVFFEGRTCVSIATEEGVSKMAITNRLKKVYAALGKKLTT